MRLLVVDYDYFFPCPDPGDPGWQDYDWSHNENYAPLLQDAIWESRASNFLLQDKPLPLTNQLQDSFWDRFSFTSRAHGYLSDSNFFSMHQRIRRNVHEVVLFDAHHDCGYEEQVPRYWNCSNWGLYYLTNGADVVVNYPCWRVNVFQNEAFCYAETIGHSMHGNGNRLDGKVTRRFDPGGTVAGKFDKVHICRSGAWVPPWCDHQFTQFVAACPVPLKALEDVSPRPVDEARISAEVAVLRALFAEHKREQEAQRAASESGP